VQESYIPSLHIKGDVTRVLEISRDTIEQMGEKKDMAEGMDLLDLGELVAGAGPVSSCFSVYMIAGDGRTAVIRGDQLERSYIGFSSRNGWEAFNPGHPVSTNIKGIGEIVVVLESREDDFGLNIITMDENITHMTPGRALLSAGRYFELGGTSFKDSEGSRFETSTFEERHVIGLQETAGIRPETVILMGSRGEYLYLGDSADIFFAVEGNRFVYQGESPGQVITDLKGVVLDPSVSSIMDVYHDASGFIGNGTNVLLIITDGMGYHQYIYALENGYAPYLASASKADMALSVYRPVTNSGLAAMLTGVPPSQNGIYSREQRVPEIPTILGKLLQEGEEAVLIEGDIQVISTEIDARLHTDTDSDGTIDDEIFEAAWASLDPGATFMAVHFHGIDDAGHDHGDMAQETMESIREADSYIRELASGWRGKVIITSDHGMHSTAYGGDHGEFRYEDMVVPYIIIDGGL